MERIKSIKNAPYIILEISNIENPKNERMIMMTLFGIFVITKQCTNLLVSLTN